MKFALILLLSSFAVHAAGEEGAEPAASSTKSISLVLETISLSLADAAALIREDHNDADLYQTCIDRIEKSTAKQESLTLLRCLDGGETTTQAVLETIYPSEYEPPEMPNSVSVSGSSEGKVPQVPALKFDALVTPATPTSFETRNIGISVDLATAIDHETGLISAAIAPEWVRLTGRSLFGQGMSEAEMPEIELQQLDTSVTLRPGKPFLLGTFNRTPESKVAPEEAERVWFAFVTARVVEP